MVILLIWVLTQFLVSQSVVKLDPIIMIQVSGDLSVAHKFYQDQ
jgi:hypothetical protein